MASRKNFVRNKEKRPQEIIDSAIKLFIKKGFESTTFADIAKDCNIARSTIYLYFSDKHDLLEKAIIARISENRAGFLEGSIDRGNSKQEFIQNVLEKVIAAVDHKKDDPFYVFLIFTASKNKRIAEILKKHVLDSIFDTWEIICKDVNFTDDEKRMYLFLIFSLHFTSQVMNVIYKDNSPFIQLSDLVKISREQMNKDSHIKNGT